MAKPLSPKHTAVRNGALKMAEKKEKKWKEEKMEKEKVVRKRRIIKT
jgi:hypothetical protein